MLFGILWAKLPTILVVVAAIASFGVFGPRFTRAIGVICAVIGVLALLMDLVLFTIVNNAHPGQSMFRHRQEVFAFLEMAALPAVSFGFAWWLLRLARS
jgi:hypothetical protein